MSRFIFPEWTVPACVKSVSTTRLPGVGAAPYDNFNLGLHVGDDAAAVHNNRKLLEEELELPGQPTWMNQVHGSDVFYVEQSVHSPPVADAAWTDQPGCVLSVMTADCLPLLLATADGKCIAVIHGGWRGLLAGVIEKTVGALPASPQSIVAWLGPAIGPLAFEVGGEVREAFVDKNPNFEQCFQHHEGDKFLADIFTIGRLCLESAGVPAAFGGKQCTFQDRQHFFSYRRDGSRTGRMASLIWIDPTD